MDTPEKLLSLENTADLRDLSSIATTPDKRRSFVSSQRGNIISALSEATDSEERVQHTKIDHEEKKCEDDFVFIARDQTCLDFDLRKGSNKRVNSVTRQYDNVAVASGFSCIDLLQHCEAVCAVIHLITNLGDNFVRSDNALMKVSAVTTPSDSTKPNIVNNILNASSLYLHSLSILRSLMFSLDAVDLGIDQSQISVILQMRKVRMHNVEWC